MGGQADGSHPFPEDKDIREILAPGAGRPAEGQPFFLDILHSVALNIQDPDHQFPRDLEQGVPLKVAKRGGAGVPTTPGRPSADHFSELIRGTFLEEVGCEIEDLCPGPLAGIDEGDKIRTIYDGSVGGANDTIRNQTVERTPAPTVLDGVQALHWLHAAAAEGPRSQGVPGPEKEVVKPPPESWLWPEPGTRWVLLKADVTKRVKVLRKDWRFQVASLGEEWWVNKVGTYGMASAQSYRGRLAALLLRVLYALFSSGLELRLCG